MILLIVLILAAMVLVKFGALMVTVKVLMFILQVIFMAALLYGLVRGTRYLVRQYKAYKAKSESAE